MGCGVSDARGAGGKPRPLQKRPEEPELNGKAKFLSCPVVGDMIHPDTKERWFVIAFAPQNFYGLVVSARNVTNGTTLLAKEVTDQQLAKEKEDQGITMSWNLFFKAIASEISKINRTGAKGDFNPDGSITFEIKIAIAGAAAQARKTDQYRFTLSEVDNSPSNVFKYFLEPIASYFCKKKTDLSDRPDPQREKTLGELEAATVVRMSTITAAKAEIESLSRIREPLRAESESWRTETDTLLARVLLTRHVVLEKTDTPEIVKADPFVGPFTCHVDPEEPFQRHVPHKPNEHLIATEASIPLYPLPMTKATDDLINAIAKCEHSLDAVGTLPKIVKNDTAFVAAYLFLRFVDLKACNVQFSQLCNFLSGVDALYESQTKKAWGQERIIATLGSILHVLCALGEAATSRIASNPEEWLGFITAAYCAYLDHPGMCNELLRSRRSFLSTLYSKKSPVQRHAVASALQLAKGAGFHVSPSLSTHICNLILCTDLQLLPPIEETVEQRTREILDFSRQYADRTLAAGLLLRAVDVALVYGSHAISAPFRAMQQEEDSSEREYAAKVGISFFSQGPATPIVNTFRMLQTVFPTLSNIGLFK
eukprot:GILI01011395.1.p1 GENE.GILI01011395.1~~GILI01011395.1.p1  ORF type:complete len:605 (+),score=56.26 GILI01011395.1:29-1816(+)